MKNSMFDALHKLNLSVFFQTQIFLLPVLLLFYQHNGLTTGDFFLFQGIFSLAALLLEVPAGYIGDLFPKKNVLILSYGCFVARLLLWLFFAGCGWWIILTGELLYAAQKAFFSGISDGYVYEYLKFRNQDRRMLRRYGKMNFWMSAGTALSSLIGAWCYHHVSEWSLAAYHRDYGFTVLLIMELILNGIALGLVCRLPQVPVVSHRVRSLKEIYLKFFRIIVWTCRQRDLRNHITYSGILAAMTLVFVWSFQPLMEHMAIPVALYGVVYFINHLFRAVAAWNLDRTMKYLTMPKLGILAFILFIACFILSFLMLRQPCVSVGVGLGYFIFLSLTIGVQLTFYLANIGRIHRLVPSDRRATVSSFNTAFGRLCAGLVLILMKFLIDGVSTEMTFGIYFLIFLVSLIPLCRLVARPEPSV